MWTFLVIGSVIAIIAVVAYRLVSAPPPADAEIADPEDQRNVEGRGVELGFQDRLDER